MQKQSIINNKIKKNDLINLKKRVCKEVERQKYDIIKFHSRSIQIPSVNTPPTGGEAKYQAFIAAQMKKMGLEVKTFEPDSIKGIIDHPAYNKGINYKNRPNVLGFYKRKQNKKSILLMAHADTELTGKHEDWIGKTPFSGIVKDNKIYGRGAGDNKDGVTTMIFVFNVLKKLCKDIPINLCFASVVDEEQGGRNGSLAGIIYAKKYIPDIVAGIYLDGYEKSVSPGNLGGGILSIKIKCKGSQVTIDDTFLLLKRVYERLNVFKKKRKKKFFKNNLFKRYYESLTMRIGEAKLGTNDIGGAQYGELNISVYLLHGEKEKVFLNDLNRCILQSKKNKNESISLSRKIKFLETSEISQDEPIVSNIKSNYNLITGKKINVYGSPMCDLFLMNNHGGFPSVMMGSGRSSKPGIAHSLNEFIYVDRLLETIKITAGTIIDFAYN